MSLLCYLATVIIKSTPLIPIEDRLSALPDSILCHILSFLPTKHSAATSILSKRWNSLWLSVFTLDLVAKNLSDIETLDSVILLRDIKVPIQTLRLKFNVRVNGLIYDDPVPIFQNCCKHINSLISAATQRGVETLELDMHLSTIGLDLASNVFNYNTLTVLKLTHVSILNEDLAGINTSLKTLHLDHVYFRCHTHILNFLLSFPTLEELQANVVIVEKVIPERLMIKCLPNLMRATLSDSETIPLFLLSRALILSIKLTWTPSILPDNFYRLLLMEHKWSQQIPTFHNLTQIELSLKLDSNMQWKWMLEMLQHCPKLQHLIIKKIEAEVGSGYPEFVLEFLPGIVPECLSSQLRTCLFKNCRGQKIEIQFAEYIMRNSKALCTMAIHISCSIDLNAKSQVLQKLSLCPRSCKLIFD